MVGVGREQDTLADPDPGGVPDGGGDGDVAVFGDAACAVAGAGDQDQAAGDAPGQQISGMPVEGADDRFVDDAAVGVDRPDAVHGRGSGRLLDACHRQRGTRSEGGGVAVCEAESDDGSSAQIPKSYVDETGYPLGSWVGTQRNRRAKCTLTVEQQRRLEQFPGWTWDVRVDLWELGFRHLNAYDQRGNARVPTGHVDQAGYRLGQWCKVQRRNRNLSAQRRRQLEALPGWTWDAVADQWERGFQHLAAYVDQHGHAQVPDAFGSEDKFRLGQWVGVQRRAQSTGSLSAARQLRLAALPGWTWNPIADQWEHGFAILASFVEEHGHARVPKACMVGTFRLGQWVLTQRDRYAKERMPGLLHDQVTVVTQPYRLLLGS
ncbi:helicase associated domain-containing protein [Nocardia sp. NPDC050799]|uniref:helicase associated domain-containing protein n=1 Tax=Nocardia sp. NPDC050799 TaxID=3154842 RepID=UPI00340612C4